MAFGVGRQPKSISPLSDLDYRYAGFEVLTEVFSNISIFWDITPHSPLKVY
jgi:hypothetical protein